MFIEFHDDESIVTRSCVWCSEDMPMDADISARMLDEELFCNECVTLADPFTEYGVAVAWPDCGEYIYQAKQVADNYTSLTPVHGERMWLAIMHMGEQDASEYVYGHTSNQLLNSLVSSAACFQNHRLTERIALSTN